MDLSHHDVSSIRRDDNYPTVANHVKKEELLRNKIESERLSKRELVERLNAEKEEIKQKAKFVVDMFKQKVADSDRELSISKLSFETLERRTQFTNDLLAVHLSKWRIWNDYLQNQDTVDDFAEFLLQQPLRVISLGGDSKNVPVAKTSEIPALMISELDAILRYRKLTTDIGLEDIPYLTVVPSRLQQLTSGTSENFAVDHSKLDTKEDKVCASPSGRRPLKPLNMNSNARAGGVNQNQSVQSPTTKAFGAKAGAGNKISSAGKPPRGEKFGKVFNIFEDDKSVELTVNDNFTEVVVDNRALHARIFSLEEDVSLLQATNSRHVADLAIERAARQTAEQKCAQFSSLQAVVDKLNVKVQKLRGNLERSKAETVEAKEALQRERDIYSNVELRHTTELEKFASVAAVQAAEQAGELERLRALLAEPSPAVVSLEQKNSELNALAGQLSQQLRTLEAFKMETLANEEGNQRSMLEQQEIAAQNLAEMRCELDSLQATNVRLVADIQSRDTEIGVLAQAQALATERFNDCQHALEAEISRLGKALQDSQESAKSLLSARDAKVAELQRRLEEHSGVIGDLERKLVEMESTRAALDQSLLETSDALATVRGELSVAIQTRLTECDQAGSVIARLELRLSDMRVELEAERTAATSAAQLAAANIADLESEVSAQRALASSVATEVQEQLRVALETVTNRDQEMSQLVSRLFDWESKDQQRETDLCVAVASVEQLQFQVRDHSSKVAQLETEVAEQVDIVRSRSAEHDSLQKQFESLQALHEKEIAALHSAPQKSTHLQLAQRNAELDATRAEVEQHLSSNSELQEQVSEQDCSLREAEHAIQLSESRCAELLLQCGDLQHQVEELSQNLISSGTRVQEMTSELSQLRHSHAVEKEVVDQQCAAFALQVESLCSSLQAQELLSEQQKPEQDLVLRARNAALDELQFSLDAVSVATQTAEIQLAEWKQKASELQTVCDAAEISHNLAISVLKLEAQELSCALDAKTVACATDLSASQERECALQSKLEHAAEELSRLRSDLSALQFRYDALCEAQLLERDDQIALLRQELAASTVRLLDAEATADALRESIATSEAVATRSNEQLSSEIADLQNIIHEKEGRVAELTGTRKDLLRRLEASDCAVTDLRALLSNTCLQLEASRAEEENWRATADERAELISVADAERLALQQQVVDLTEELRCTESACAVLEGRLNDALHLLSVEIEAGEVNCVFRSHEACALHENVLARNRAMCDLDASAQDHIHRCVILEQQVLELQASLSSLEQDRVKTLSELESSKTSLQELADQIEDREAHIATLFEEVRVSEGKLVIEQQRACMAQSELIASSERTIATYSRAAEEEHAYRAAEVFLLRAQLALAKRALVDIDMCERDRAAEFQSLQEELLTAQIQHREELTELHARHIASSEQAALHLSDALESLQTRHAEEMQAARSQLEATTARHETIVADLTAELNSCRESVHDLNASLAAKAQELSDSTSRFESQLLQESAVHSERVAELNAQLHGMQDLLRLQTTLTSGAELTIFQLQDMIISFQAAAEEDCEFRLSERFFLQEQLHAAHRAICDLDECAGAYSAEVVRLEGVHAAKNCQLEQEIDRLSNISATQEATAAATSVAHGALIESLTAELDCKRVALNETEKALEEERVRCSELAAEAVEQYDELQDSNSELSNLAESRLQEVTTLQSKLSAAESHLAVLNMTSSEASSQLVAARTSVVALEESLVSRASQVGELQAALVVREADCSSLERQVASLQECCQERMQDITAIEARFAGLEAVIALKEEAVSELTIAAEADWLSREAEVHLRDREVARLQLELDLLEKQNVEATLKLTETVEAKDLTIHQLHEELAARQAECIANSTQAAILGEQTATLRSQLEERESTIATLEAQVSDTARELAVASAALSTERSVVEEAKEEIRNNLQSIRSLESTLVQAQSELAQTKAQETEIKVALQSVRDSLAAKCEGTAALAEEVTSLRDQMTSAGEAHSMAREENQAILSHLEARLASAESGKANAVFQVQQLRADAELSGAQLTKQLESAISAAQSMKADLESKLSKACEEIAALRSESCKSATLTAKLQAEITEKMRDLEVLTAAAAHSAAENDRRLAEESVAVQLMEQELRRLQGELQSALQRVGSEQALKSALSEELQQKTDEVADLQSQLSSVSSEKNALSQELQSLQQSTTERIQLCECELEGSQVALLATQTELATVQADLTAKALVISNFESAVVRAQGELAVSAASKAEIEAQLCVVRQSLSERNEETTALAEEVTDLRHQAQLTEEAHRSASEAGAATLAALKAQLITAESDIAEITLQVQQLQEEVSRTRAQVEGLQVLKAEQETTMSSLSADLSCAQEDIARLRVEADKMSALLSSEKEKLAAKICELDAKSAASAQAAQVHELELQDKLSLIREWEQQVLHLQAELHDTSTELQSALLLRDATSAELLLKTEAAASLSTLVGTLHAQLEEARANYEAESCTLREVNDRAALHIAELESKLSAEYAAFAAAQESADVRAAQLEAQLQETNALASDAKAEHDAAASQLQAELSQLTSQCWESERQVCALQEELAEKAKEILCVSSARDSAAAEVAALELELQGKALNLKTTEQSVLELRAELDQAIAQREEVRTLSARCLAEKISLEANLDDLSRSLSAAQLKLVDQETVSAAQVVKLASEVDVLQAALSDARLSENSLSQTVSNQSSTLAALHAELEEAQKAAQLFQESSAESQDRLCAELREVSQTSLALRAELEEKRAEIDSLHLFETTLAGEHVAKCCALQMMIDERTQSLVTAEQRLSAAQADVAALQSKLDDATAEISSQDRAICELQANAKTTEEQLVFARNAMESLQNASHTAQADYETQVAALQGELQSLGASADLLRCELIQRDSDVQTLGAERDRLLREKAELLAQLDANQCAATLTLQQAQGAAAVVAQSLEAQLQILTESQEENLKRLELLNLQLCERDATVTALEEALAAAERAASEEKLAHKQDISEIREQLSASEVTVNHLNDTIADLTTTLEQLQSEHAELLLLKDSLETDRDSKEQALQVLLTDTTALKKEIELQLLAAQEKAVLVDQQAVVLATLQADQESKVAQISELNHKLEIATHQHQEISAALEATAREYTVAIQSRECAMETLKCTTSLEIKCLESELAEVTSQLSAVQQSLEASSAEVISTQAQLAMRDTELAAKEQSLVAALSAVGEASCLHDRAAAEAREQVSRLEAFVAQLQSVLDQKTSAAEELRDLLSAAQSEMAMLQEAKLESTAQLQTITAACNACQDSLRVLNSEAGTRDAELSTAQEALADRISTIAVLQQNLESAEARIVKLQNTVAESSHANEALLKDRDVAVTSYSVAAAEIAALNDQLRQLEERRTQLEHALAAAQSVHAAEVSELKGTIRERECVAQEINTRFLSMVEDTDDMKRKLAEVTQQEGQLRQEVQEKTAQLEALQMDNGVLAAQDHFRSKEVAELHTRLHALEGEAAALKQQLHVRTLESADLTVSIRHKQDAIQEMTATAEQKEYLLQQYLDKEAEFADVLSEVNAKLQKSEERAAKFDIQLMSQTSSVADLKAKLASTQKTLEEERRCWVLEREEVDAKAQENEFVIQELSSRVEEAKVTIDMLEERLRETETMHVNVCDDLFELRTKYDDLAFRTVAVSSAGHDQEDLAAMADTIRTLEQQLLSKHEESVALRDQLEALQTAAATQKSLMAQREEELQHVLAEQAHLSTQVYEIKSMEVKVATLEELLATAQHELQQYHEAHQEAENEERASSEVTTGKTEEEIRTLQTNLSRLRAKVASKSKQVLLLNQQMLRDRQNFQKLKKSLVKLDGLKSAVFANNYNPAVPAPPLPVNQVSELYHMGMDVAAKKLQEEREVELEEQRGEMALIRHALEERLTDIEHTKAESLSAADECIHEGSMSHLAERITDLQEELARQVALCQDTNRQLAAMRAAKSESEAAHYLRLSKKVVECTALRAALDQLQKQLIKLKSAQMVHTTGVADEIPGEEQVARATRLETQLQVMTRMQQEGAQKFEKAVRTLKALEARGSSLSKEVVAASAEIQHLNRKLQKPTVMETWEEIEFFA